MTSRTSIHTDLDPVLLVEVVRRLIRVGVPPTAIANAFDMDPGPIKSVARNMRRDAYGTDELAEAHSFLTWLAYEQLLDLIQNGSPEIKLRAAMQIQAKAMAISARQTPEEMITARDSFRALAADIEIAEEDLELAAQEYENQRAAFVPTDDLED